MDFLGGDGTRDFFRISELGHCDLQIAYSIVGVEERQTGVGRIAMLMGSALEPVINQVLMSHGLSIAFGGEHQLYVALEDPYIIGHPDGLIFASPNDLSGWARRNLPIRALERLDRGEVLLHEAKTMKDDVWKQFVRGGVGSMTFTSRYLMQVNGYMHAMQTPARGELWPDLPDAYGYQSFKRLLDEVRAEPPTAALITALNTHTKRLAFELIEYDPNPLLQRMAQLQVVADYLHRGETPPPSYDGRAPDCFTCPFAHACPATQKIAAEEGLLSIPLTTEERQDLGELDELAATYDDLREQLNTIKAQMTEIRDKLKERVNLDKVVTPNFSIRAYEVSGRETVDMDALLVLSEEYGFAIPKKKGRPYTALRVTNLYGPTHKDGEG